jgi:hypothetical protein
MKNKATNMYLYYILLFIIIAIISVVAYGYNSGSCQIEKNIFVIKNFVYIKNSKYI